MRSSLEADSFRRDEDERELIEAGEVAQMLGMTVDWVYEQSRRGRIPTITLGALSSLPAHRDRSVASVHRARELDADE